MYKIVETKAWQIIRNRSRVRKSAHIRSPSDRERKALLSLTLRNLPHIYIWFDDSENGQKGGFNQEQGTMLPLCLANQVKKEEERSSSVVIFLCEYSMRIMNCPTKRIKTFFIRKKEEMYLSSVQDKSFLSFFASNSYLLFFGGETLCVSWCQVFPVTTSLVRVGCW